MLLILENNSPLWPRTLVECVSEFAFVTLGTILQGALLNSDGATGADHGAGVPESILTGVKDFFQNRIRTQSRNFEYKPDLEQEWNFQFLQRRIIAFINLTKNAPFQSYVVRTNVFIIAYPFRSLLNFNEWSVDAHAIFLYTKAHVTPGLHNSESSKGQTDQHKLATGRKSLFRGSVEEILKGQVIIRSRAYATFSATDFSRAARKDLAGRMWPAGCMLCRPALLLLW